MQSFILTHVIGVLASFKEVLAAHVAGSIIHHEITTFHFDGVTTVKVRMKVGTVTHALMVTAAKVSILIEDNL